MIQTGKRAARAIPDWVFRTVSLYGCGILLYAIIGGDIVTSLNISVMNMLSAFGLVEGGLFQNTWIGGVVEPLMSKWFPLIVIGMLGPVAALARIFVAIFVSLIPIVLIEELGHPVSMDVEAFVAFLAVAAVVMHHIYTEGGDLNFPEEYQRHPWATGAIFGATFGLLELEWYLNDVGVEFALRVPPLLMHIGLGSLICGSWIILSTREGSLRNDILGFSTLSIAVAFHTWFNVWLSQQDWFQQFWLELIPGL